MRRQRSNGQNNSEGGSTMAVDSAVVGEHTTTLVSEKGKTIISDGVVAKIAGLAAREVEGVHHLVDAGLGKTVVGLARAVTRQTNRDQGILVEVGEREAAVDVRLC